MNATLPPEPPDDEPSIEDSPPIPLILLFLLATSAIAGLYAGVFWGVASRITSMIAQ